MPPVGEVRGLRLRAASGVRERRLAALLEARGRSEDDAVLARWPTTKLPAVETYRWLIAFSFPSVTSEVSATRLPPMLASKA